eukprot:SAG31_NODE_1451_length_8305_cov_8.321350_1_plen_70_part_10
MHRCVLTAPRPAPPAPTDRGSSYSLSAELIEGGISETVAASQVFATGRIGNEDRDDVRSLAFDAVKEAKS